MKGYFPSLFISIVALLACTKKEAMGENEYTTLIYQQTFCSDPWTTAASDSLTLNNVQAYINSNNLYLAGLSIKQTSNADTCKACTCKTGKTLFVSTLNSEVLKAKYIQLGFKVQ